MQNSASQVKASYSFDVAKNGNRHTITYQKAKYGVNIMLPILFPSMLVSFMLVIMMRGNLSGWITMTLVLCGGAFFLLNFLRKDGSFSISDTALMVDGKEYDKAHISKLFVKEPGGYEETTTLTSTTRGFVVGGDRPTQIGMGAAAAVTGVIGGVAQAGGLAMQSSRRNIQKQHQQINYAIGFRYGEKDVTLATGLKENTAHVMLDKVIELSNPVV